MDPNNNRSRPQWVISLWEVIIIIIIFDNLQYDDNHFLNDQKEIFRLYQHLARCPKTIQLFLHMNPQYHCFIPMTYE